ncbi:hypothetical protein [Geomonas sp.]|uniref:hypothetical protein n=1 Tax=Geomonas sp. TaxID=2651584 RepID=UPI002B49534E|nr:hypothetical protein [Geomonas sp.]HJV36393.1 hypothetical protein [Geomonas sp.]
MHDIDRTLTEFGGEYENGEFGSGEYEFEFEGTGEFEELESPFNEMQEMELASELLMLGHEAELNHFLGDVISKAAGAAKSFVASPTGQALGGILKQAAKKALPVVGGAIGGYFGGSGGADIGRRIGRGAGDVLGLEQEGMSQEDREFEMARRFVRFAGAAARRSSMARGGRPQVIARRAASLAARRYLPFLSGLYSSDDQSTGSCSGSRGRSGRWYRRGNKIILVGI